MKRERILCLLLTMALLFAGALPAFAEGDMEALEATPIDAAVEEIEAFLGEEPPEEAGAAPGGGASQPQAVDVPEDAAAPDPAADADAEVLAPEAAGPLTALSLPQKLCIGVGEKVTLSPVRTPANAVCTLSYATSKKKCVAVSESGEIAGKKKGVARVTVTADNGVTAAVEVTVMAAPKSVSLEAPAVTGVGDSFRCQVAFSKKAGGGYTLRSDNEGVLRVAADGTVSALAAGSANLTVTSFNDKQATAAVRVLAAPTSMWLDQTEAKVGLGGPLRLTPAFPAGSGGTVRFETSNAGVASVDPATGEVRGVALGSAVITARSYNGLEDRCAVQVLPAPQSLSVPSASVSMSVGEQAQLQVTPQPEGSVCSLTYTSGKAKVATVSDSGVVTALKKGTSVITVTAQNGVKVKVKVTVLPAPKTVSLQVERSNLAVGETTKVQCVLPKKTATLCTFSADDNGVVRIAQDGTITALAEGAAKVYVKTSNGLTASAQITVGTPQAPSNPGMVSGPFEITFMNIGRNDGILIHCGGEWAFIDSGTHSHGEQAVQYMKSQGVDRLKYYIATHSHEDHIGGAPVILAALQVDQVIIAYDRVASTLSSYARDATEKQAAERANYRVVERGDKFWLGGAEFLVLGPVRILRCKPEKGKENGNSLIIRVTYGANTFLLTGDASKDEFREVEAASPGCLRAQVFKNPHHQCQAAYAAELCMPEITIFSTDRSDMPKSKYRSFLEKLGTKIYYTASHRHGHIKIVSDGKNLSVTTQYQY